MPLCPSDLHNPLIVALHPNPTECELVANTVATKLPTSGTFGELLTIHVELRALARQAAQLMHRFAHLTQYLLQRDAGYKKLMWYQGKNQLGVPTGAAAEYRRGIQYEQFTVVAKP